MQVTRSAHVLLLSPTVSIWCDLENILSNTRINFSVKYFQCCLLARKNVKSYLEKEGTAKRCFNYCINKLPNAKSINPGNASNSLYLYHHRLRGDQTIDRAQLHFNSLTGVQL